LARFDLYQPRGFRTDYQPRDFDDQAERGPSGGSPQLAWQAGESDRLYEVRGLAVASRPECLLHTINDNRGQLFPLHRLSGSFVVAQGDMHTDKVSLPPDLVEREPDLEGAIGAIRPTDVLALELLAPASEALAVAGRGPALAALWSFAQLEIGLQPTRLRSGGGVTRRVFLADRLENGAGYCRLVGEPVRLERVLDRIVDEIGERFQHDDHAGTCDSSCPDCLRSYDNRRLHPLLDWRLGLDLAELAAARPLDERRWLDGAAATGGAVAEAFGLRLAEHAGLPALRDGGNPKAAILCHPMWSAEQRARRVDGLASVDGAPAIRGFDLYTAKSFPDEIAVWLHAD
jgi:DEAD/DEAH box helicase domain-containing protein